jgi:pimeloyl-ACP methyl ester carboxylesterase
VLWAVLAVVAGLVVLDLLIHAVAALVYILPSLERSPPVGVEPSPPCTAAELIELPSGDGLTLRGAVHRPSGISPIGLIIFCPELGGDHWSALRYCRGLLDAGFCVLAFDFRNQGRSDHRPRYSPIHWLTEFEVADALAAAAFASRHPDLRDLPTGMFGISRGGSAALTAGARLPRVRSVAAEGVFSISTMSLHYALRWASLYQPPWVLRLFPTWHFRLTLALTRWLSQRRRRCRYVLLEDWLPKLAGRPLLIIVDGRDTYVLPEISETLFCSFPEGAQRWLVPTARHNMARDVEPHEFDLRVSRFFLQMVASPGPSPPGPSGLGGLDRALKSLP